MPDLKELIVDLHREVIQNSNKDSKAIHIGALSFLRERRKGNRPALIERDYKIIPYQPEGFLQRLKTFLNLTEKEYPVDILIRFADQKFRPAVFNFWVKGSYLRGENADEERLTEIGFNTAYGSILPLESLSRLILATSPTFRQMEASQARNFLNQIIDQHQLAIPKTER